MTTQPLCRTARPSPSLTAALALLLLLLTTAPQAFASGGRDLALTLASLAIVGVALTALLCAVYLAAQALRWLVLGVRRLL
jgi:hypothetical protein